MGFFGWVSYCQPWAQAAPAAAALLRTGPPVSSPWPSRRVKAGPTASPTAARPAIGKAVAHRYRMLATNMLVPRCCGSGIGALVSVRIRIRIQIQIHIQGFDDQKLGKFYSWNKILYIFLIKNCNLLILGLRKGRPSYRRSLHPSKENIQHF